MNTIYQPGHHPDAERLSAFAEQALPPNEQRQTLAHLATCTDCRALLYLAQQTTPFAPAAQSQFHRPTVLARLSGWIALPAAASLAALILLTFHLHHPSAPAPTNIAASIQPAPPPTPPVAAEFTSPEPSRSPHSSSPIARPPVEARSTIAPRPPQALGGLAFGRALTPEGAIHGTVTDISGAVLSNATVTATNTLTGASITRDSAPTGNFSIAPLQPGTYAIEAAAPGFQRLRHQNVQVQPLQPIALDMKLNVGAASETVTVSAAAPPELRTSSAVVAGTIANGPVQLKRLPAASPQPSASAAPASATAAQSIYGGTGQADLNQNYTLSSQTAATFTKPLAPAPASPAIINAASLNLARSTRQPILPSHLPALAALSNTRQTLALDTGGSLFRSTDAGVTWKPVPTQWQGRATRLILVKPEVLKSATMASEDAATIIPQPKSNPALANFELTTDTNTTYTSPDGQTWHRK